MIPVIDLFAGPGGLGEGFSSLLDEGGGPVFRTIMSVEKDPLAHRTLLLRAYVRKILEADGAVPQVYARYLKDQSAENRKALTEYRPSLWQEAQEEALCAELVDGDDTLVGLARRRLEAFGGGGAAQWALIGGPPCQAYSLAGRSRRAHDEHFDEDPKHTLYKCYLAFIRELKPTVFVMENVKGLLTARHRDEGVFARILDDMGAAGYEIRSLVREGATDPREFVVQAERYGIPQARHRVILLGVRKGVDAPTETLAPRVRRNVGEALAGIPRIRSGFSTRNPGWRELDWKQYVDGAADRLMGQDATRGLGPALKAVKESRPPSRTKGRRIEGQCGPYGAWYRGRLGDDPVLANHESRSHLASDLDRYLFCAAFAASNGYPAKISDFPHDLLPAHKNVHDLAKGETIKFNDRFRVQVAGRPSTTITSHISKDGHYYIHPDPAQCRSLTVREAARLQTFPDDYLFEGPRTSQYTQVGNAVPPLLAQQIATVVARYLGKEPHSFSDSIPVAGKEPSDANADDRLF